MNGNIAGARRSAAGLPREHGFWVLLAVSLSTSMVRARALPLALAAALPVALMCVLVAATSRRFVRRSGWAQLIGAVLLAFAGVPLEALGGVSPGRIGAGAALRAIVFGSSVLLVRAALATSGKRGRSKSAALYATAGALAGTGMLAFAAALRVPEAIGCAFAAGSAALLAWCHPTSKQLKPLGLYLAGLTLLAAGTGVP
jgi:hypothetical protein